MSERRFERRSKRALGSPHRDPVSLWAHHLLAECGSTGPTPPPESPADGGRERWARSGAAALTGYADGPPLTPSVDLGLAADGAALALATLVARRGCALRLDGAQLLGERAALVGLHRQGSVSPGGSTRLLRAGDGWVAIGLRRPEDADLVPALIRREVPGDPWPLLASWLTTQAATDAVERAQLLGLPAATAPRTGPAPTRPWRLLPLRSGRARRNERPLVVDFSTLWAGPLATSLLLDADVDVVKVESPDRPDGGRTAAPAFFDRLNAGKLSMCAAPDDPLTRQLLERADLVVTSARPRALEQLGLAPTEGRNWLTITGHGYAGDRRNWVAYGDDAAIAGGVLAGPVDGPVFCADAVADPLTGLHAAVAALGVLEAYGRGADPAHVDISLAGVMAHLAAWMPAVPPGCFAAGDVAAPQARAARGRAADLGADNDHPLVRGRS